MRNGGNPEVIMNADKGNNPKDGEGDLPRFLESKPLKAKQATPAQKKQRIILGVLSLFLVFLMIQTFTGAKRSFLALLRKRWFQLRLL